MVAACGGDGSEPQVELAIETPTVVAGQTILKGRSFVPAGSTCPQSADYIRIGMLGTSDITYRNAATGASGPVFPDLWVCNSENGRVIHWTSNPIALVAGDNIVTVTMVTPGRTSIASIVIRG